VTTIRVLLSRALDLVLGRRRDERLTEEIQAHLDLLTDEYVVRGMTPAEARLAARRAFGGVDQVRAVYRDQRGLPFVDALTQDVRFAVRLLRRDRGFAVTSVLVLGLGIGVNNMLFTILNAHTIRGLPMNRVDRVVHISTFDDRNADRGVSYADFEDFRSAAQSFVGLAAFTNAPVAVAGDGHTPERLESTFVSENAFALIGTQPVLGRSFAPEDDRPGAAAVAILGSGAWQSRYGGDRAVLGRSILVNGAAASIIGVMPERSGFPSTAQVWLPLWQTPGLAMQKRDAWTLRVFGRVRDGVTVSAARAEIESIADRLSRDHPETNTRVRARVVPINERYLGRLTDPAWLAFMTAGFLVVVISCANVANLMLARSVHRAREIAIRTSLGASRRRVVRQLLIEGGVLATLGGVLGLGVAMTGVRLFRSAIPENVLPYWFDYSMDGRVVTALIAISLGTVFVFALLPAIHASKTDVNRVLKAGGPTGTASRVARRWATAFLIAEFALTVVLLAQLAVSLRIASPTLPADPIIDTRDVLTAAITLPAEQYRTPDQRTEFYRRFDERLRAIPSVSSMSVASALPFSGAAEQRLDIAGRAPASGASQPTVWTIAVRPRYFETLGLTLTRGRDFTEEDGSPGHAHAVVNTRFAQQFFGDQDPIGQRIALSPPQAAQADPNWLTVIGVSPDIRQRPVDDPDPLVYLPYRAAPPASAALLVRSGNETAALASLIRNEVLALDPNLPLYRMRTMTQVIRDAQWNGRVAHNLVLVLTFIAVGLSTVGLYAVTAHGVSQRTHEIGVRTALGARPRQVIGIILRRALVQLALGFTAGIACTLVWDRLFSSGRAGVRATDPQSLIIVAAMLTVIAGVACSVPARRATHLDPVAAIRHE
jgi:putative ABC transport system permease protein